MEIEVVDSHTAGEPTRVIISGGPDLGAGTMVDQLARFRDQFDCFRTAVVCEPRGSDVLVGAILCQPDDPVCDAGVIFFNNVGYLGMCGHGMIGVAETLRYLGRLTEGSCRIETPVGRVTFSLQSDHRVTIENVESWRTHRDVSVDVPGIGMVIGDVAYGGNWFFMVKSPTFELGLGRVDQLQSTATRIREAVHQAGHTLVDHVELFAPTPPDGTDSQNFVLCPGLQYDRSPCGTGTSAKLACLAADGTLGEGESWVQSGILGTSFEGRYEWADQQTGRVRPRITGSAHVTAHSRLRIDPTDPFAWGIVGG